MRGNRADRCGPVKPAWGTPGGRRVIVRRPPSTRRPAMTEVAGVEEIRSHFPALARSHNGFPVAYFDGPGGTQVPRAVTAAMTDYLLNHNANTHWDFPTSRETDAALGAARAALADWLGGAAD